MIDCSSCGKINVRKTLQIFDMMYCQPIGHEMSENESSMKAALLDIRIVKWEKQTHTSLAVVRILINCMHVLGQISSTDTVYRHDIALRLASSNGQEIIVSFHKI